MDTSRACASSSGSSLGLLFRQVRDAMWARMADELSKAGHDLSFSQYITLKKLAAGRYGDEHRVVAAINLDVGRYLVANEGISGIRPAGDFKKVAYGIGLSRQKVSEAQFGEFNAALQELIRQGKVREILRRHGLKAAR